MRGERILRNCSQPRTWSRKRTLKSFEMQGGLDNVVVIDVDNDRFDNVIIIDVPESFQQNVRSSSVSRKGKKNEFRGIISIEDDETNNVDPTAPDFVHNSEDLDDDECRVVKEEKSAFKFSKCKQAFSGKNFCQNRYGLYPESESCSGSSDSDCSDCEVIEGSFGKLHEEWKKASLKRKSNVCKGKSGFEDQASPSFMNVDTRTNVGIKVGKGTEETAFFSNSSSVNYEKQKFSAFVPTEEGYSGTASQKPGKESSFGEFDQKVDQDNFSWLPPDLTESRESFQKKDCLHFSRETFTEDPSSSSEFEKEKLNSGESVVVSNSQPSYETGVECGAHPSKYKVGAVFDESFLCKTFSSGISEACNEKAGQQDTDKPNSEGTFLSKNQCAETQGKQGSSHLAKVQEQVICSTSNNQRHEGMGPFHAQGVSVTLSVRGDVINERERHKETDEHKRSREAEWASRQQQLKIQAEEAQRLRKKKRAERMRVLDMERRQKRRLEEIRETLKKDEENMNLKEQLRAEVTKQLHKLETTCIDMASLLRGLGIHVGSSFNPSSHEVHAAYKRALLQFHPDRALKTDIRQQVEAEEKFKLISRMKEKFLLP